MKSLFFSVFFIFALKATLIAQSCATGFCPPSITVHHVAGPVSPLTTDITYGIVSSTLGGTQKCWITRNLGASQQATSATDAADASAGWYWQFNRMQAYSMSGSTRTPNTTWIVNINDNSNWTAVNDPCTLLLGNGWSIPTLAEWTNAISAGGWSNYSIAYASALKMHAAGRLNNAGGFENRGAIGNYWSSTQNTSGNAYMLYLPSNAASVSGVIKDYGFTLRCCRTY